VFQTCYDIISFKDRANHSTLRDFCSLMKVLNTVQLRFSVTLLSCQLLLTVMVTSHCVREVQEENRKHSLSRGVVAIRTDLFRILTYSVIRVNAYALVSNAIKNFIYITHWHTQTPVRRSEPSMSFLLILAFCQ